MPPIPFLSELFYNPEMGLYARIAWFNFEVYLAYPIELVAALVRPFLALGFRLLFWAIVAAGAANHLNFHHLVAYFLLTTGLSNLVFIGDLKLGNYVGKAIKYGWLSEALIKPVNPLIYEFSERAGWLGATLAVSLVFVAMGLWVEPPVGWLAIGLFVVFLGLALAISLSLNVLIGTIAFFFTESTGIKNMIKHVMDVLSGSLAPIYLFPGAAKTIVLALPFATAVYGPVQALEVKTMDGDIVLSLVSGVIWAIVLAVVARRVWRKGLSRYEAIGI